MTSKPYLYFSSINGAVFPELNSLPFDWKRLYVFIDEKYEKTTQQIRRTSHAVCVCS